MNQKLSGVLPPLSTPFKDDEPDLQALKENILQYNKTQLTGYLALGTNGEAVYLSEAEKAKVIDTARQAIPRNRLFLVGAGLESTKGTIAFIRQAADLGANYALVLPPHYYKAQMTPARLAAHYTKAADDAAIPVLIYNMPANTGLNMNADLIAELSHHPNIVGVKDSSGNMHQLSEIVRQTEEDFSILVGASPMLYPSLCLGADGGILAVANVMPHICCRIQNAFDNNEHQLALDLHRLLTPLATMVTSGWGVPALKLAMNQVGYQGGRVRSPLADITEPEIIAAISEELVVLKKFENE